MLIDKLKQIKFTPNKITERLARMFDNLCKAATNKPVWFVYRNSKKEPFLSASWSSEKGSWFMWIQLVTLEAGMAFRHPLDTANEYLRKLHHGGWDANSPEFWKKLVLGVGELNPVTDVE